MSAIELKIIHTNDLHAHIEKFGKLAAYIDSKRSQAAHFLYLDAGDISSGHPAVDWKHGKPIVELLNEMKLDAMTVGNHDFDYGQENFERNKQLANFPWLSANMTVINHETPISQPEPYKIFEFKNLKVGVVAITETPPSTTVELIKGLHFEDPVETLNKYLSLRETVDILIALTHVGSDYDRKLAEQVTGYDLIIGGHSHDVVELEMINGTPYINTGAYGEYVGDLTVLYSPDTQKVEKIKSELVKVEDVEEVHADIQTQVEAYFDEIKETLQREIGVTNSGLSIENIDIQDVPLGNFWTDALRFVTNTDVALTNNGGIRNPIHPGKITAEQIFSIAPFQNSLVVLEMTGEAIKEVIMEAFKRYNRVDLQISGMTYVIWTDEENHILDVELFSDGKKVDPERTFQVVTNDYIALGGTGYNFQGKLIRSDGEDMALAMIRYAEHCMDEYGAIDYESEQRIVMRTKKTK